MLRSSRRPLAPSAGRFRSSTHCPNPPITIMTMTDGGHHSPRPTNDNHDDDGGYHSTSHPALPHRRTWGQRTHMRKTYGSQAPAQRTRRRTTYGSRFMSIAAAVTPQDQGATMARRIRTNLTELVVPAHKVGEPPGFIQEMKTILFGSCASCLVFSCIWCSDTIQ